MRRLHRQDELAFILDQGARPVLQPALTGVWEARYYETLAVPHPGCVSLCSKLLEELGLRYSMPFERENGTRQEAADCGWWVLHHVEEEARRKLGEGKWTQACDLKYRVERAQATAAKLKPAEERAKAASEKALAKEKKEKAAAAKAAAGTAEAAHEGKKEELGS